MAKATLSPRERRILEQHGVIPAPKVPSIEKLGGALQELGGRYELNVTVDGAAQVTVYLDGKEYPGVADDGSQALCSATCQALEVSLSKRGFQASFLPGDGLQAAG